MDLWLQFLLMVPLAGGELALIGVLLGRRERRAMRAALRLGVTLALIAIWAGGLAVAFVGHPFSRTLVFWWQRVAAYSFSLAATPLFFATWAILHRRRAFPKSWFAVPAVGLLAAVVLDPAVVPLNLQDWHVLGRIIRHEGWWRMVWTILWAAPTAVTWWLAIVWRPRHVGLRTGNRLRYWTLALAISLVADGLILSSRPLMAQCAGLVKLLAGTVMTATLVAPWLPDSNRLLRLTAGGIARAIITLCGFAGVLWLGGWVERGWGQSSARIWLLAGLAAGSAALYATGRFLVHNLAGRLASGSLLEDTWITHDYEKWIGHGLEVEHLAEHLAIMVDEALAVQHTTIATVHAEPDGGFVIRPVLSRGCARPPELRWDDKGLLAQQLLGRGEALSAGDLETDPSFDALSEIEREELIAWASEMFVPISADDRVLGILAVGPKQSGTSYGAAEVGLLEQLAARAGPALAYARRMDHLAQENENAGERIRDLGQLNRELQELDRLKSGVIATLTHDLRVPFVAIDRELVQLDSGEPAMHDHVAQLARSLDELRRLVDHLIGFAAMVGKQGALKLEPVHLPEIVDEAAKSLEVMSRARRVTVRSSLDQGMAPLIADRGRLADTIYQLMHNAIKFNRAGGEVAVRAELENGWTTLEVEDTGCGIAPEQLEQLGMPGMPLPNGEERRLSGMGLGLGLALAHYVAQAHGGRLEIQTELGSGSTFRLHLPVGGPKETFDAGLSPGR
jgi:signal transduction histidine kinase